MSTVAQVESAIERLSADEQRQLLQWLLTRAATSSLATPPDERATWLNRLARLRAHLTTGKPGPSVEQLLEEDRGEQNA